MDSKAVTVSKKKSSTKKTTKHKAKPKAAATDGRRGKQAIDYATDAATLLPLMKKIDKLNAAGRHATRAVTDHITWYIARRALIASKYFTLEYIDGKKGTSGKRKEYVWTDKGRDKYKELCKEAGISPVGKLITPAPEPEKAAA